MQRAACNAQCELLHVTHGMYVCRRKQSTQCPASTSSRPPFAQTGRAQRPCADNKHLMRPVLMTSTRINDVITMLCSRDTGCTHPVCTRRIIMMDVGRTGIQMVDDGAGFHDDDRNGDTISSLCTAQCEVSRLALSMLKVGMINAKKRHVNAKK